jgi:hypothetical protein
MNVLIDTLTKNIEKQNNADNASSHDSSNIINNYQQQIDNFWNTYTEPRDNTNQTDLQFESVTSHDSMSQIESNYNQNDGYDEEIKNRINNQLSTMAQNWYNLTSYYSN